MAKDWTASEKQRGFIEKLLADRVVDPYVADKAAKVLDGAVGVRFVIDALMQAEKKVADAPVEDGYYMVDEWPHVVVHSKAGRPYAKRLVLPPAGSKKRARWEYAPGAAQKCAGMDPMTIAQAAAFGHLHGRCFRCGAVLDDPISVDQGYGPVCIKKIKQFAGVAA